MRQIRRGCFAGQGSGAKFVWAVYDLVASDKDEASATTGSVGVSSGWAMAGTSYTVENGMFRLVDTDDKNYDQITANMYLVELPSENVTGSITGSYLYQVTRVSSFWTRTIYYTRYTVAYQKGDDELYRVESETMDYPVDGVQDGLWYVMLKGEYERHVWQVYSIGYVVGSRQTTYAITNFGSAQALTTAWGYTAVPSGSGATFTLVNPSSRYPEDMKVGMYGLCTSPNSSPYVFVNNSSAEGLVMITKITSGNPYYSITWDVYSKVEKSPTGTAVRSEESSDINAYPQDGEQGDYWYTYSHSYLYEFDNR